jgi:hypothetical protein
VTQGTDAGDGIMAKFTVTVTEFYCKALTIEACDAETAEALVRGQWDQGEHDLGRQDGTFDHVEFEAEKERTQERGRPRAGTKTGAKRVFFSGL